MLKFGNKEFKNLQEQVLSNANEILEIKQSLGDALPNPIAGPQGPQGDKGQQGDKGKRGSIWTVGTDLPGMSYDGDMHLMFNGNVYRYDVNKWVLVTNIAGPQGPQGNKGQQGEQGEQGQQGQQGPVGEPSPIYKLYEKLANITAFQEKYGDANILPNDYAVLFTDNGEIYGIVENLETGVHTLEYLTAVNGIVNVVANTSATPSLALQNIQIDETVYYFDAVNIKNGNSNVALDIADINGRLNNFVDLSNNQTISGEKTFENAPIYLKNDLAGTEKIILGDFVEENNYGIYTPYLEVKNSIKLKRYENEEATSIEPFYITIPSEFQEDVNRSVTIGAETMQIVTANGGIHYARFPITSGTLAIKEEIDGKINDLELALFGSIWAESTATYNNLTSATVDRDDNGYPIVSNQYAALKEIKAFSYVEEGQIVSVRPTKLTSYDTNNQTLGDITITLPETFISAENAKDIVKVVEKSNGLYDVIAVSNVGSVDLGALDYTYNPDVPIFFTRINQKALGLNLISAKYDLSNTYFDRYGTSEKPDKTMFVNSSVANLLYIKDTAYTDAATFKTAMSGVILHYELATPTETTLLTDVSLDDIKARLQRDGTIALDNAPCDTILKVVAYKPVED